MKRLTNCYKTNSSAHNYVYNHHMQHEVRCNVHVHPLQSSQLYYHAVQVNVWYLSKGCWGANTRCANTLSANTLSANTIRANTLCANTISANTRCTVSVIYTVMSWGYRPRMMLVEARIVKEVHAQKTSTCVKHHFKHSVPFQLQWHIAIMQD